MQIIELQKDLFSMPHGYCFAHCISADLALGAGIAVEFNSKYNMRERLKLMRGDMSWLPGDVIAVDNVFNMITKHRCYQKPTYEDFKKTLDTLSDLIRVNAVSKLAIPKIGCGLDGLDWNRVKPMIETAFDGLDVQIVVCYL